MWQNNVLLLDLLLWHPILFVLGSFIFCLSSFPRRLSSKSQMPHSDNLISTLTTTLSTTTQHSISPLETQTKRSASITAASKPLHFIKRNGLPRWTWPHFTKGTRIQLFWGLFSRGNKFYGLSLVMFPVSTLRKVLGFMVLM